MSKLNAFIMKKLLILCCAYYVNGYDYYEFAVQSWCNQYEYNIHGMWPQNNNGSYPSWCTNVSYINVTDQLESNMSTYWNVQCPSPNNQEFWNHEWSKHGTCVQQQQILINETDYFWQALKLFQEILPESKNWTCGTQTTCIVACFDLNFNRINCGKPTVPHTPPFFYLF